MKLLYTVICISMLYLFIGNYTKEEITIPEESIRLRVIANSDSTYDQNIKFKVKNNLERFISSIMDENDTKLEMASKIENNMLKIRQNIESTLQHEKALLSFNVNYGQNYFPEKEFYGIKYKAGNYESLVVTLGEGSGNNWWCVLFPPLCLIEAEESTETEYRIYVKEVLDKYL